MISARYRLVNLVKFVQTFRKNGRSMSGLVLAAASFSSLAAPALAHHAMGGKIPANLWEGFLSGLAHPLIGPDHFAFIIAVGLLAATCKRGIMIPLTFVLAAMAGTGLHLAKLNVPGIELFVSGSILLFGILLAQGKNLNTFALAMLSALAGLFHGYAYGESIFGAESTSLEAYLAGFTVIQLIVSLSAWWVGKSFVQRRQGADLVTLHPFRSAGLVITGIGLAFFATQVVNVIFPLPKV